MLRVGVTGATGSGKSSVCEALGARGWPVIDADRVAHGLYVPGSELVATLAGEFGSEILDHEGGVDRSALGARVFSDFRARERLNDLVHPLLVQELDRQFCAHRERGTSIAVLDAALLLQWDSRLVDTVVGVVAPRPIRRDRLLARGVSATDAERRLDAQVEEWLVVAAADLIIDNGGNRSALDREIERAARRLETAAAKRV